MALAALASTAVRSRADLLAMTIEKIAFEVNSIKTRPAIKGRLWMVTAGMLNPAKEISLSGLEPSVRNKAMEVATNPIARTPTMSRIARPDRKITNVTQASFSFGFKKPKAVLSECNTGKV
jgi:hypothetical protein